MATKTKTKAKKKTTYNKIHFSVQEFPGCCGIGCISDFHDEAQSEWIRNKYTKIKTKFASRKAQAKDCLTRILDKTWPKEGVEYGYHNDFFSYLQIALVSHYHQHHRRATGTAKAQFPEFQAHLIDEGWTIVNVFINPNHGNEITVFGKYFPERNVNPYDLHDDMIDEDDDEDY